MTAARVVLLPAAAHKRMPWKNGGGETIEVAVEPAGAALDAFDWRVSMATVSADGPFSAFPGVDRTLSILDGAGLSLTVGDAAPVELTPASAPHAFPADVATSATLIGGPVTDLNVMTRRSVQLHSVRRFAIDGAAEAPSDGADTLIALCASGAVTAAGVTLGLRDALRIDRPSGDLRFTAHAPATVFLITLHASRHARRRT